MTSSAAIPVITIHGDTGNYADNRTAAVSGTGRLIAVNANGNVCLPFNSEGMYRGFARIGKTPQTVIYR